MFRGKRASWPKQPKRWAALLIALGVSGSFLVPTAANASVSDGFQPGNIISDALFYNGSAMSAQEVQNFLNARVPRCIIGDGNPAHAPGAKFGNTTVAKNCLRDYRVTTATKPSSTYCRAYAGAPNETAAQIITRVGQACNISQKVLLVLLEKEQSLITDTWPTELQYRSATGYGCPDTAPCAAEYYGFFNQVYRAAWTFNYYKQNPNQYNYKPGQNNRIFWHPNAGCGTSNVYIENSATAGLYIYTPYRPNQAALNAGWGTGDSCSTYGNRNFYNFYKSWFGQANIEVNARLSALYQQQGGAGGKFGAPLSAAVIGSDGSVRQEFRDATFYWSSASGAGAVKGEIRSKYLQGGGPGGPAGYPTGAEVRERDGGYRQEFQRSTGYWSSSSGTQFVFGYLRTQLQAEGGVLSGIGYPTGPEQRLSDGGYTQRFQGASGYWTQTTGARFVKGYLRTQHDKLGGATGAIGYPTGPEVALSDGGYSQEFERASASWSAKTGTQVVKGIIRERFLVEGGPAGPLGYPTGAEVRTADGGFTQEFQKASAYWSEESGANFVKGLIRARFHSEGAATGHLGYPVSGEVRLADGEYSQVFQRGTAYFSDATGAFFVKGLILASYRTEGESRGHLGYPLAAEVRVANGEYTQEFQRGTAFFSDATGAHFVKGEILKAYLAKGGPKSDAGYPLSAEVRASDGSYTQRFQKASAFWSESAGVSFTPGSGARTQSRDSDVADGLGDPVAAPKAYGQQTGQEFTDGWRFTMSDGTMLEVSGAIATAYRERGGPDGDLGLPQAQQQARGTNYEQRFEFGTLVVPRP